MKHLVIFKDLVAEVTEFHLFDTLEDAQSFLRGNGLRNDITKTADYLGCGQVFSNE